MYYVDATFIGLSKIIMFKCKKLILSEAIALGLATSQLPLLQDTPRIAMADLLQAILSEHTLCIAIADEIH
jgi:hypothetical protein